MFHPVLCAVFAASCVFLIRIILASSPGAIVSGHALLNAESGLAASLLLGIFIRTTRASIPVSEQRVNGALLWVFAAGIVIAFAATLNAPLLYDAYGQITRASTEPIHAAAREFWTHPHTGDFFYRPLGRVFFSLDYQWAGFDPVRWHCWSLAVHLLNSFLLFALAKRFGFDQWASATAALVFALHGSHPEVVSWTAGRFDLLVTCFVLGTLLSLLRYAETGDLRWYAPMLICAVLALISKEEAYCLPLLAVSVPLFRPDLSRRLFRATGVLTAVVGVLFLYRLWVLGGIGGYGTAAGQPTVLDLSPLRAFKMLFLRLPALLTFPTNWSVVTSGAFRAMFVAYCLLLFALLLTARAGRRQVIAAIAFTLAAALPVQHLLGVSPDLNGARVLYLPTAGFGLLIAAITNGCRPRAWRSVAAVSLILFQGLQLEHNLLIWRRVAFVSQRTCRAFGAELARDARPAAIASLPTKLDGVYFLRDAFPDCVRVNSGEPPDRIYVGKQSATPADARNFRWDDTTETLQETTRAADPNR